MKTKILYLFLLLSFLAKAADDQPNVLFIIVDQHSGLMMNQAGYDYLSTPGIDKLADDGTVFTRSYCSYPVCTSARKTFMTGEMPSKLSDVTTHTSIGEQFKNNGYETVFYGKWHVGSTKMDEVAAWHNFDIYTDARVDSDVYDWSSAYLKKTHEKPFFMVTSFLNPHDCCELARNIAGETDKYHDGAVEENADTSICPPLPSNFAIPPNEAEGFYTRRNQDPGDNYWDSQPTKLWTEVEWRQYMYGYDRLVEKVDQHVENLYDDLVGEGLLDNTIIVYTSDHGDGHASHSWTQKKSFYEESVNVPLIISWKGKLHEAVIDKETLASGLDIYPTILSLAGITPPTTLPGKDLSPVLLVGAENPTIDREYVVSEINQKAYKGNTPGTFIGRMVVSKDYKYFLFDQGVNREQLFDLKNDPGELVPVGDDPAYASILIDCRNQLKEWVTETSADFDVDAIVSEFEANALLDAVQVNGVSIDNFDPQTTTQVLSIEMAEDLIFDAVPVNSASTVSISELTIFDDAAARSISITVTSEDQSQTVVYDITLEEKPDVIEIGFVDNDIDVPLDGWTSKYSMISENINGPGNHDLYSGPAAFKFTRGQSDKAGYLTTSFYEDLDSVSFWLYVYEPAAEAGSLTIEANTAGDVKTTLLTISTTELSESAWTEFVIPIDMSESIQLIFTPSLPADGDTRLWMDDMTLIFNEEVGAGLDGDFSSLGISIYPNPCGATLNLMDPMSGQVTIYDITGEPMLKNGVISSNNTIDVSSLEKGIYVLEIRGTTVYTQQFIKGE